MGGSRRSANEKLQGVVSPNQGCALRGSLISRPKRRKLEGVAITFNFTIILFRCYQGYLEKPPFQAMIDSGSAPVPHDPERSQA